MKKLIKGIINFRKKTLKRYRNKFSKLALTHTPDALFVACCDSRVVPNVFASSDPGDLFVLRNIGNLIPPYQAKSQDGYRIDASVEATIEFSLTMLEVRDIVICGHSECGAMHAIIENEGEATRMSPSLSTWLGNAASSYKRFKDDLALKSSDLTPCNLLSRINVIQQMDNLKTYPLVMERLQRNNLKIHGWWFDLATADVYYYDQKINDFILIDEKEAKQILKS